MKRPDMPVAMQHAGDIALQAESEPNDRPPDDAITGDMIWIPGGTFRMGSDNHYPEEAPAHRVTVDGFWIDRTPVTNRQFKEFVRATGYRTLAEIPPDPKDYPGALPQMIYAGSLVFSPPPRVTNLRDWSQWWEFMKGADWRHPYGPKSNINVLDHHPVVHVSFRTRSPTRDGRARICRPKRNGSLRRGAVSTAPSLLGAMNSRPAACTWPTPGRANFRDRIRAPTAMSAPRRDGVSAERLRRARHDRQRLGMDVRLVCAEARSRCAEGLLHS
jgi:hypothetical protein